MNARSPSTESVSQRPSRWKAGVTPDAASRSHFAMIPYVLLDDPRIGPHEVALYAHYVRRGRCWESAETTARAVRMGTTRMRAARQCLSACGYVRIVERAGGTTYVRVVDVWRENRATYLVLQDNPEEPEDDGEDDAPPQNNDPNASRWGPTPGDGGASPRVGGSTPRVAEEDQGIEIKTQIPSEIHRSPDRARELRPRTDAEELRALEAHIERLLGRGSVIDRRLGDRRDELRRRATPADVLAVPDGTASLSLASPGDDGRAVPLLFRRQR